MSSPSAPSDDAAAQAVANVNIDALIDEIQRRPVIWDKTTKGYADRLIKSRMWDEVYENIIENWSERPIGDKQKLEYKYKKKWRNLKDSFAKELAIQKKGKSGQGSKKRRPYIHFQALMFLASQPLERDTSSNVTLPVDDSDEEDSNNSIERENRKQVRKTSQAREKKRNEELLDIIRQKKTYDEDISFTEMLVPLLKKLNDDQKHFAKVEILSILNIAKRYRPPEYQTPQTQHHLASEPNRYYRTPYPQDSRRRMSSVMSNYTPSPPSTLESPAYVVSPSPSPNYTSSQPLSIPQQAQASSSGNQATGTSNYASYQPLPIPQQAYTSTSGNQATGTSNYASYQPLPIPQQAYTSTSGNQATGTSNYAPSQLQPIPEQANALTSGNQMLLYDDQRMEMDNYTQENPANMQVSEHADADIIYSANTASPVVGRLNGTDMKNFLIFKRK